LKQARAQQLLSADHFTVDGTLIEAWAGQKSFQRKDGKTPPPEDGGSNPTVNFHGDERRNDTHRSTTDPEARLARKSGGHESKLAYCGNVLIENRNGLVVDTELVLCSGTAERDAALEMAGRIAGDQRVTVGADKGYDTRGFVQEMRDRNVTPHVSQNINRSRRQRDRWAHDTACRISGEPAQTETDRGSIWVVKDGGNAAQDAASRSLQSGLGVHLRGRRLQSGADAEPCGGSLRISSGRSVPGRRKVADSGTQSPRKCSRKVVGERPEASPSNYFINLLSFRPLNEPERARRLGPRPHCSRAARPASALG
jgi:hypothetical protein